MIASLGGAEVVGAIVGVLFVALGLAVGAVRFREKTNRGFALFAVAWGLENVLTSVHSRSYGPFDAISDPIDRIFQILVIVLLVAAAGGLTLMARRFPDPVLRADRREVVMAAAAAAYYVAFDFGLTVWFYRSFAAEGSTNQSLAGFTEIAAYGLFWGTVWGVLVLLALRYPAAGHRRPAFLLASAALGVFPAYWLGWLFAEVAADPVLPAEPVAFLGLILPAVVVVGLWLRNAGSLAAQDVRPRWMAWFLLGSALVGMVVEVAGPQAASHWGHGIASAFSVIILGYAIIRHQVLGIDVKMRWTISRGTLAALFVAVFFVVSEGAQILFGSENPWVGLLAAGLLVFAIAPLQRAAERLAVKAVPMPSTPAASSGGPNEDTYRRAVRRALRDSVLVQEEERDLVLIAAGLGIAPARAFEIRDEVERERAEQSSGVG